MTKFTHYYKVILFLLPLAMLAACSTNQATGKKQFTAFMPASSEAKIGAEEHDKILESYGGAIKDAKIQNYVQSVGQRLVPYTERNDVKYTFTVLDTPIMNAFALPGGYVYISRGILMYANDEAELASVIGHEIGHVTGQHSAQRYSQSVLAGIGGMALSVAVGSSAANQVFGLGANLYLSSYSRAHESEADSLGIRYISKANYDPNGSPRFLQTMDEHKSFSAKLMGKEDSGNVPNYFSTHPVTAQRVADAKNIVSNLPQQGDANKVKYMQMINGMVFGDSPDQGFLQGNQFIHPKIGFAFSFPRNYYTENSPEAFLAVAKGDNGAALIFEGGAKPATQSLADYARVTLAKNEFTNTTISDVTNINGIRSVTVQKRGTVGNKPADIFMVAYEWDATSVFTMKLAIPDSTSRSEATALKQSINSFRRLSAADRAGYKPQTILIRAAKSGDTVQSFASLLPFQDGLNEDRFRMLNGMNATDRIQVGRLYKTIVQ